MYNKLTIQESQNKKVYFVSDLHFCHDRPFILEKRGFKTIQEHDETLIERWNKKVRPSDVVINCGDFILGAGQKSQEKFYELINRLNGRHIYLWGNHNAGAKPSYQKLIQEKYENKVEEVYPLSISTKYGSFEYRGYNLLVKVVKDSPKMREYSRYLFCSHFAHRLWIDSHKGRVWHISGHSHGSDPESQPESSKLRLDVGIENFGEPISLEEVERVFENKKIEVVDHHDKSTNPSF